MDMVLNTALSQCFLSHVWLVLAWHAYYLAFIYLTFPMDHRRYRHWCGTATSLPGGNTTVLTIQHWAVAMPFQILFWNVMFYLNNEIHLWFTETFQIWIGILSLSFTMGSAGVADAILLCSCQHLLCLCAGSQRGTSCYLVTDLSQKFLTVWTAITAWKEIPKVNVLSRGEGAMCICHACCSLTGGTQI